MYDAPNSDAMVEPPKPVAASWVAIDYTTLGVNPDPAFDVVPDCK